MKLLRKIKKAYDIRREPGGAKKTSVELQRTRAGFNKTELDWAKLIDIGRIEIRRKIEEFTEQSLINRTKLYQRKISHRRTQINADKRKFFTIASVAKNTFFYFCSPTDENCFDFKSVSFCRNSATVRLRKSKI
jgi:predicted methyltransferase